jgi:hypothetical protein
LIPSHQRQSLVYFLDKFKEEETSNSEAPAEEQANQDVSPSLDPVLMENGDKDDDEQVAAVEGAPSGDDGASDDAGGPPAAPWKYKPGKFWNYIDDELVNLRKLVRKVYKSKEEQDEGITEYEPTHFCRNTNLTNSQVLHAMLPGRCGEVSRYS